MHHYVLIRNLRSLVHRERERVLRTDNHLCRNCFHVCSSKERYDKHIGFCQQNRPAVVRMPQECTFKYKKIQSRWFAPIVGFFDLESIIESVSGCGNNPKQAETRIIEIHKPCSYALLFVAQDEVELFHFECVSGLNVMSQFVASLEQLARKIYSVKQRNRYFSAEAPIAREDVTECCICEETLENTVENPTVLDHCHFTGQFLGWAHNNCNINRKFLIYTPLFAHNLSNYDLHHVILALQGSNMRNTISIIPSTDEKFIALEIVVLIKMRPNKNGVDKPVYEHIRLLDSFRFMPSSLDTLAKNLPANEFIHLENYFSDWPKSSVDMLKQKKHFPYNYIESFSKLGEARLPPREKWTNSLQQYDVSVTEDEYKHALTVFETFKCKTIGEYYNLYLKTNAFLLASVLLCFRKVCYQTYGLDCCQYYSASNLSGDAMLKICKAPLELLTERESNWILLRGSFGVELAPFIIRDSQLPTTNIFRTLIRSSLHTFIVMIDANNLYGGIMEKFSFASQRLWIHRPKMGARNWAPTYPESAWHFRWKQRWVHSRSRLVLSRWASWSTLRFSPSANETKSWIMLARRLSRRTPMWYENERASLNQ